jgi:hypothetical protein
VSQHILEQGGNNFLRLPSDAGKKPNAYPRIDSILKTESIAKSDCGLVAFFAGLRKSIGSE